MQAQMKEMGMLHSGFLGIQAAAAEWEPEELLSIDKPREGFSGRFRDDLTGQLLCDAMVAEARAKELEYFAKKQVWQKANKASTKAAGHKVVSVRWVDVNKGDNACPNYRSRLVARQLKAHDRSGAVFFAPTPPLEALRTVLSRTATRGNNEPKEYRDPSSERRLQLSTVDISRAYFNAKTDPLDPVYVSLPEEDPDHLEKVGLLLRHMYGTRRAADGWQEEYSSSLVELGFGQGSACPCVFYNGERDLLCSVHGDDFTTRGPKAELDWFEQKLAERYELKVGPRLGPAPEDAKEVTVLNRVLRWTDNGLELEADPRQGERLVQESGLEGANPVCTPGARASTAQVLNDEPLPERFHTAFRAAAARANYLAQDRPDCQFACKEIRRWMAKPTTSAFDAIKRLGRFLVGQPRLVWRYAFQDDLRHHGVLGHRLGRVSEDPEVDLRRLHPGWQTPHKDVELHASLCSPELGRGRVLWGCQGRGRRAGIPGADERLWCGRSRSCLHRQYGHHWDLITARPGQAQALGHHRALDPAGDPVQAHHLEEGAR